MANNDFLRNVVSFSDFNKGQADKIFNEVKKSGAKLVVKNNNPVCVIVSFEDYVSMVDEINDMRALLMAIDRMENNNGNLEGTFSQEEVEKMLEINTNAFEDVEIG